MVVVAARYAYPEYLQRGLYICQAERAFRDGLTHMAFYASGAIQSQVPRIRYREDLVTFTEAEVDVRSAATSTDQLIGAAIKADLAAGTREEGKQYQFFLLSGPDDPDTFPAPSAHRQRHGGRIRTALAVDDGSAIHEALGPDTAGHPLHERTDASLRRRNSGRCTIRPRPFIIAIGSARTRVRQRYSKAASSC